MHIFLSLGNRRLARIVTRFVTIRVAKRYLICLNIIDSSIKKKLIYNFLGESII